MTKLFSKKIFCPIYSVATTLGALTVAVFFIFGVGGCSTSQIKALLHGEVGMTKGEVLDIVGDPARSGRLYGQDRWAYVNHDGSADETTYVFFSEGRVTYVGPSEGPPGLRPASRDASALPNAATPPASEKSDFRPVGE